MAFGVTRNSDVEIVSVALTNVLNEIDGVGEEWTSRFLGRCLPGLVASQSEDILATRSMCILGISIRQQDIGIQTFKASSIWSLDMPKQVYNV
jgi:hypothetical protein